VMLVMPERSERRTQSMSIKSMNKPHAATVPQDESRLTAAMMSS
jgi:hypothetical protein